MLKTRPGKEITLRMRNDIGVLAELSRAVAEKGVNILALSAWVEGEDGVIHLVTDDNLRAVDILKEKNYNPSERGVVMVEAAHKPGMLRHIAERLAGESIDIHHIYATGEPAAETCLVVFACSNNDRAIVLLNE